MGLLPPDSRHPDPVIQRLLDWLRRSARDSGKATATWPGGTNLSGVVTVPHSLGRTPARVFATGRVPLSNTVTRGMVIDADPATFTDKQFQCRVWLVGSAPVAGTELDLSWEAVG